MRNRRAWLAVAAIGMAWLRVSAGAYQRPISQNPQPAAAPVVAASSSNDPAVRAEYGVVAGRRDFSENSPEHFIREAGYPPGVFAVAIADRSQLLAFDVHSISAAVCMRIDPTPVAIPPNVGARYFRFRCPGAWDSREVVFLDGTEFLPTRGEQLEWTVLPRPSPLPMPRLTPAGDLHDYTAIARTTLLPGQFLISAAWFAGEYLPRKEYDVLRDDFIAFGHYQLLDRTLFIGESQLKPSTVLYESREPIEVREGIEWALLPKDASEKTEATISTLYEFPNGYLVRVSMHHDHEGFGDNESTYFYAWERGRWRLLAKAEETRIY